MLSHSPLIPKYTKQMIQQSIFLQKLAPSRTVYKNDELKEPDYIQDLVVCLITQSCPILCDPMDCNPPGFSVLGDSPGKNTGMGCHALLQGIFLTQGSELDLWPCREELPEEPIQLPYDPAVPLLGTQQEKLRQGLE